MFEWLNGVGDWFSDAYNDSWLQQGVDYFGNSASGSPSTSTTQQDLIDKGFTADQAQSMLGSSGSGGGSSISPTTNFNSGNGNWSSGLAGALVTGVGGLAQTYFNQKQQRQIADQQSAQWDAQFQYQKTLDDRNYALAQASLAQQAAATAAQAKEAKRRSIVDAYQSYLNTSLGNEQVTQKGYSNVGDSAQPLTYRGYGLK